MYFNFVRLWNVAKLQCKKGKVYIYTFFGQRQHRQFWERCFNILNYGFNFEKFLFLR